MEMLLLELNLLPKILIERILTRVRQQECATRDGKVWFAGSQVYSGGSDWSNGDTIGFAFNANTGHMYIYINGSSAYDYDSTMSSSAFKKPAYSVYPSWSLTFNFGENGFDETPPTGYLAVNTDNGATTS